MAYQPIQLPDNMGVNAGLDQLNASIDDLAKWKRDQARYKTEQGRLSQQDQRLARMDASQALAEAHALAQKGDIKGAQARLALAGATGLNFQDPDAERQQLQQELGIGQGATAPGGPAAMPGPPSQPQQPPAMGGSAVPDQVDQGRSMQSDPEAEFSVSAKAPPQGGPDPLEALMQKPASAQAPAPGLQPPPFVPPGAEPAAQPPGPGPGPDKVDQLLSQFGQGAPQAPQNELQKALAANNGDLGQAVLSMRNNQQGQRAEQARRLITGKLNGVDISIEPDAERNYAMRTTAEDRQRQAGMIGGALGDQKYDQMLTKLTAVYGPEMASKMVVPLMEKDAAARERAQAALDKQEHSDKIWGQTQDRIDKRSELNRQAGTNRAIIISQPGLKNDANNRSDSNSLEGAVKNYWNELEVKKLVSGSRKLHSAIANAAAEGPDAVMAHKDAYLQLAGVFRGAIPTDKETEFLTKAMGGIPGAIKQYLEDLKTGDFSDITKANLARSAKIANDEVNEQINGAFEGLKTKFGPGSQWQNMGPQVDREVQGLAKGMGISIPSIYGDQTGGVVLNSGRRQRPTTPTAAPSSGPMDLAGIHSKLDEIEKKRNQGR